MSILHFKDLRAFLRSYLESNRKTKSTRTRNLAKAMKIKPAMLSHILSGKRNMTLDQAFLLAQYLEFSSLEFEYLSGLVTKARTDLPIFKVFLNHNLSRIQDQSRMSIPNPENQYSQKPNQELKNRSENPLQLTLDQQAQFYSSWIYSAMQLYCSTEKKGVSVEQISQKFNLSRTRTRDFLDFLLLTGLVKEVEGLYSIGVQRTSLPSDSPFLPLHHKNWRLQSIRHSDQSPRSKNEFFFSSPISVSKQDYHKILSLLIEFVQKASQIVAQSEAQDIAVLNLDLFWLFNESLTQD